MQTTTGRNHKDAGLMTILVIDRSRPEEIQILDQLKQAGHRILDLDAGAIDRLLPAWSAQSSPQHALDHGGIALDPHRRTVHVHGRLVELSRLEFEFLHALIESPFRVLSHGELAERVWENYEIGIKTIAVLASRLRRRISDAGGPRVAQAVHGVGYRLACAG
jgi:DNA-binding response OmpR family regulator